MPTSATLEKLAPVSGTVTTSATLMVDAPFATGTGVGGAVPTSCPAIVTSAKDSGNLDAFLSSYGLQDKVNAGGSDLSIKDKLTSFQTGLAPAYVNQLQDITSNVGYPAINSFITALRTTYLPVINLVNNCLRENIQIDTSAYDAAKAKAEESKLRLQSILTPEQHLSYYDGWFPLIRPMTESALFGIFGAALFMLLIAILVFLRMTGVQIQLEIPEMTELSWLTLPPNASYYIYGGLAFGLIGTVIAYRFVPK
jgi:hypothetical protein